MKVLVTGADGVLGSNLVRELLSRKHEVSVFLLKGTSSPTLEGLDIHKIYGNILNQDEVSKAFEGMDVVIHGAANTSLFPARDSFVNKVNIDGTKNAINAAKTQKIKRLIYIGTANSFGNSTTGIGIEGNAYESHMYGLDYMDSKRRAQEMILQNVVKNALPAIVVNPTFMIGPYDSKPSSGAMIIAIKEGKIPGYTKGGKNYVYVKDVAFAIANAMTMGRIGECYILGNENLTHKEAFEKIAENVGAKPPSKKISCGMVKAYGKINSFFGKNFRYNPSVTKELAEISCDQHYYSCEKAKKELLLPSTPIEIAIKDCYNWFLENHYLN